MATSIRIDQALESDYNVRAARTDYDDLMAEWVARSEALRADAGGFLDVPYGQAERERLDIFTARTDAPTLVYLHGGYWQRGDKSILSFVAEPFVRHGVNVVVMGYTLCPDTTVPGITEQIRNGLVWLYRNGSQYGLASDRLNVSGHSAGGHLTAMMLATDWSEYGNDIPAGLVKTGIPISGLYDLAPLRRTSLNELAGIDDDAARRCSPRLLQPASTAPVLAVLGGAETGAFQEQTETFVERWSDAGARIEAYTEPGVDHFDIVNRFADQDSVLFRKTLAWLV